MDAAVRHPDPRVPPRVLVVGFSPRDARDPIRACTDGGVTTTTVAAIAGSCASPRTASFRARLNDVAHLFTSVRDRRRSARELKPEPSIATDRRGVARVHIECDFGDAECAGGVLDKHLEEFAAEALPPQFGLTDEDASDSAGSSVAVYPAKLGVADRTAGLKVSDGKRKARPVGRRNKLVKGQRAPQSRAGKPEKDLIICHPAVHSRDVVRSEGTNRQPGHGPSLDRPAHRLRHGAGLPGVCDRTLHRSMGRTRAARGGCHLHPSCCRAALEPCSR